MTRSCRAEGLWIIFWSMLLAIVYGVIGLWPGSVILTFGAGTVFGLIKGAEWRGDLRE